jgi:hypothetical protein
MAGFIDCLRYAIFGFTIEDREFGTLRFEQSPIIGKREARVVQTGTRDQWIGSVRFAPCHKTVCVVFVIGSRKGPTDEQRSLFRAIEARWPTLLAHVIAEAEPIVADWTHSPSAGTEAMKYFQLEGITLDATLADEGNFSLHFSFEQPQAQTGHVITAKFRNWELLTTEIED